jgi:hypothetical protein
VEADIHVSLLSRENRSLLTRVSEERARTMISRNPARICASRPAVPAFAEPDIHLLSRAPKEPSQKIEYVFAASPETIRGSLRSDLLCSVG